MPEAARRRTKKRPGIEMPGLGLSARGSERFERASQPDARPVQPHFDGRFGDPEHQADLRDLLTVQHRQRRDLSMSIWEGRDRRREGNCQLAIGARALGLWQRQHPTCFGPLEPGTWPANRIPVQAESGFGSCSVPSARCGVRPRRSRRRALARPSRRAASARTPGSWASSRAGRGRRAGTRTCPRPRACS